MNSTIIKLYDSKFCYMATVHQREARGGGAAAAAARGAAARGHGRGAQGPQRVQTEEIDR